MVATILSFWWWLGIKIAVILKQHEQPYYKENEQNTTSTIYSIYVFHNSVYQGVGSHKTM